MKITDPDGVEWEVSQVDTRVRPVALGDYLPETTPSICLTAPDGQTLYWPGKPDKLSDDELLDRLKRAKALAGGPR